jgi:hypothetical protein
MENHSEDAQFSILSEYGNNIWNYMSSFLCFMN